MTGSHVRSSPSLLREQTLSPETIASHLCWTGSKTKNLYLTSTCLLFLGLSTPCQSPSQWLEFLPKFGRSMQSPWQLNKHPGGRPQVHLKAVFFGNLWVKVFLSNLNSTLWNTRAKQLLQTFNGYFYIQILLFTFQTIVELCKRTCRLSNISQHKAFSLTCATFLCFRWSRCLPGSSCTTPSRWAATTTAATSTRESRTT